MKITARLIQKHFGADATVKSKFFGDFNVTTPTGGDVDIGDKGFKIHCGGEDVYGAMTALASEAWGGFNVFGSDDHVLAMMQHGREQAVQVTPLVKESGAGCFRFFIGFIVLGVSLGAVAYFETTSVQQVAGALVAIFLVAGIDRALVKARQRAERRRGQRFRHPYPTIHGDHRDASHEDAAHQGWL